MNSDTTQPDRSDRWRSFNWVSRDTFAATPFYRAGWNILKRDWLVFVWKLIADAIDRFAPLVLGLLIVVLIAVDFQFFVAADNPPLLWFEHIAHTIRSGGFVTGAVGAFFMLSLLNTAIQALVVGGVWSILGDGLRGKPVKMGSTFFRGGIDGFPPVMALFLIRFAVRTISAMLGIALIAAAYHAATTGALAGLAGWQFTLFFAAAITFYLAWTGLVRLVVEVAGAPLVLDDVDVGEALLRAADFVLDNFWSLYRLLLWALGVFLIPLGIYWVFIMINNLALVWPALEPIGTMLQMAGEILVFVAATVITLLFYGAVFAFYHHDDSRVEPVEGQKFPFSSPDADQSIADDSDGADSTDASSPFHPGADLQVFIPDQAPHRFQFDDLVSDSSTTGDNSRESLENGDGKNNLK